MIDPPQASTPRAAAAAPPLTYLFGSLLCLFSGVAQVSCAPAVRSTIADAPAQEQMAQLWVSPGKLATRDLYYGPGGRELAPDPSAEFMFLEKETTGYSDGYDVVGPGGLEWSVRWAAERWTALTPDQWRAAFAAARYPPEIAERYIRKLKQKIAQGLAVQDAVLQ